MPTASPTPAAPPASTETPECLLGRARCFFSGDVKREMRSSAPKDAARRMSSLAGLAGDRGESMGDKRSADASKSRAPSLGKGLCDATTGAPPSPLVESNISDSFPAVLLLPFVYPAEKLLNICHNTPPSALPPWRAGVSAAPSLLPRRCVCVEPDGPAKLAGPEERGARNSPSALSYEVSRRWCPGSPREPRMCALASPPSREPPWLPPPAKEASTSARPAAPLGGPLPCGPD